MHWLISYECVPKFRTERGLNSGSPYEAIGLVRQHPAKFLAENRRELADLEDSAYEPNKGPQRVDEITRIFSVVEVPDGALTDEEAAFIEMF